MRLRIAPVYRYSSSRADAQVTALPVEEPGHQVVAARGKAEVQRRRVLSHVAGGGVSLAEAAQMVRLPGMTIIVHPNTYHPEAGYMVLGDVVVVTQTGCERLTRTPAQLFEMPV